MVLDEGLAGVSQSPHVVRGNLGMTKMDTTGNHGRKITYQSGKYRCLGVWEKAGCQAMLPLPSVFFGNAKAGPNNKKRGTVDHHFISVFSLVHSLLVTTGSH